MKNKVCSKCGLDQHPEEFYRDRSKKDGLKTQCKTCIKHYNHHYSLAHKEENTRRVQEWTKRNKEYMIEYKKKYNRKNRKRLQEGEKRRRTEKKKWIVKQMGGCCQICGYACCLAALEFHHSDPIGKLETLGRLMGHKKETILKEARKCVLVCANCHREIHDED